MHVDKHIVLNSNRRPSFLNFTFQPTNNCSTYVYVLYTFIVANNNFKKYLSWNFKNHI